MSHQDFSWSVPVMRVGYAGRALVYVVVGGFSLYAIWRGGQGTGTSEALQQLETTTGGGVVLFLLFLGLLSYAVWRIVDAIWDLEDYGRDGKGIVARIAMVVTGLLHGVVGLLAFSLLFLGGSSGGGSSIAQATGRVMSWPAGIWIVGLAGLAVLGAGIYYIHKGWAQTYREHLRANRFTLHYNWVLRSGLIAHGIVITIIGAFFLVAAWQADPSEAGGVGQTFGWLSQQIYGRILVTAIALGLLAFALFCAVNAAYRIVPKAKSPDIETVAHRVKRKAGAQAS